jgi:hypothetical protein
VAGRRLHRAAADGVGPGAAGPDLGRGAPRASSRVSWNCRSEVDLPPAQVAGKVTATPLPDTVILEVTVTDTSADRAQDIADALGRLFTEEVTDVEADVSTVKVTTVQPEKLNPARVSTDDQEPGARWRAGAPLGRARARAVAEPAGQLGQDRRRRAGARRNGTHRHSGLPKDIRAFMARAGELGADQALTFLREVDNVNMRRRIGMV